MNLKATHINGLFSGHKVPRKVKKAVLGSKISSTQLKLKIARWMNVPNDYGTFCPKCGCGAERFVYHEVEYPEILTECFCLRCGTLTSWADNSTWYHILQIMKEEKA